MSFKDIGMAHSIGHKQFPILVFFATMSHLTSIARYCHLFHKFKEVA